MQMMVEGKQTKHECRYWRVVGGVFAKKNANYMNAGDGGRQMAARMSGDTGQRRIGFGEVLWTKPRMSFAPSAWSNLWDSHSQVQNASIHNIVWTKSCLVYLCNFFPNLWVVTLASPTAVIKGWRLSGRELFF